MRILIILIATVIFGTVVHVPHLYAQQCPTGCQIIAGQCVDTEGNACPAPTQPGPGGSAPTQPGPGGGVTLINPLKAANLSDFLTGILAVIIKLGAIVVVIMLVFVGFKFVTAQGNESKISEARQALLWTIVGALILLGAQAISLGIQATVTALGS